MNVELSDNILLDYLSFTVPFSTEMLQRVAAGLNIGQLKENDYGGMGYTSSANVLDGARMFWHHDRPEMGIHVRINSGSLHLTGLSPLGILNRVLDWSGRITRIDIAFDDRDGLLDIGRMYEKLLAGEVSTRFRRVARIVGAELIDRKKTGDTVNVGSRSSNAFIRMYDKKKEMESRGKDVMGIKKWTRVELEMKKEKAHYFATLLANTARQKTALTVGQLCSSLLLGLLDFKVPDELDTNKSRWETVDWWREFVGAKEKLRLAIPKDQKTLNDTKRWVETQVATSLAMIMLSHADDNGESGYDFIMNSIQKGQFKMNVAQQKRLNLYNAQQEAKKVGNALPD